MQGLQGDSDGVVFESCSPDLEPVSRPDSYVLSDESSHCHHMVTCFPFLQLWAPADSFAAPLMLPALLCEVLLSPKLFQTYNGMNIFLGDADFSPEPCRLFPSQATPSLPAEAKRWIVPALPLQGWGFFTLSALQPYCPLLSPNDYPFSARDLHLTEYSSLNITELKKKPPVQVNK